MEFAGGPFAWVTRTFSASAGNCHQSALLSFGQPIVCLHCDITSPSESSLKPKWAQWRSVDSYVAVTYLESVDAQPLWPLSYLSVSVGWTLQEEEHSATATASMLAVMIWYFFDKSSLLSLWVNGPGKGQGLFTYLTSNMTKWTFCGWYWRSLHKVAVIQHVVICQIFFSFTTALCLDLTNETRNLLGTGFWNR